ncbi:hypothetical protein [Methylobacterium indicum]|uniref:Uncharacterized protein n=1 Tax=Methylobacterium indicum TaxID=1775910 RepID=A0ABR5HEL9_9HYPH|nr:hypothetical protein [Methylobacterium indicum]KMO18868.1 hypothetical protein QR78_14200 [Methylobacterium indicum]KMO25026.1 hypothetical protein QR79_09590 [Methylobacterium indicum]
MGINLPWTGMKVAFGIHDDEPLDRWWGSTSRNKRKLPPGWSLSEIDGTGARWVAVFWVEDRIPTVAEGEAVQRFLEAIRAVAPTGRAALQKEEEGR